MNAINLTPYWSAADDWAGFLLIVVPAGLSLPAEDLCHDVRSQMAADAVLYEVVTVDLAPPFSAAPDWGHAMTNRLADVAMPDGHFFAPRGLIGLVVVGDTPADRDRAVSSLKDLPLVAELRMQVAGIVVPDDRRAGWAVAQAMVNLAKQLIERYEQVPRSALTESQFLDHIGSLLQLSQQAALGPTQAPEPTRAPETLAFEPSPRPIEAKAIEQDVDTAAFNVSDTTALSVSDTAVFSRVLAVPPEEVELADAVVIAEPPPPRQLLAPVVYDGAEIVYVDQRTSRQRLLGHRPTDADALDRLAHDGRAVSLACLVFAPDDGPVSRAVAKRRMAIALELDRALASVDTDAQAGRPAHVAVEVLAATTPLRKHGVIRKAGSLTDGMLPAVPIEYFNTYEVAESLLDVVARTTRALRARGVEVASLHFVFLAAMKFPADETTMDDWMRLLERARVTWVDFSTPDRREIFELPPSPFGLHVLTDKEDVVAVVKKQSEVLYGYVPPPTPPVPLPAAPPQASDPPARGHRRRWPSGRSSQRS